MSQVSSTIFLFFFNWLVGTPKWDTYTSGGVPGVPIVPFADVLTWRVQSLMSHGGGLWSSRLAKPRLSRIIRTSCPCGVPEQGKTMAIDGFSDGMSPEESARFRAMIRNKLFDKAAEMAFSYFNKVHAAAMSGERWALEFMLGRVFPEKLPHAYEFDMSPINSPQDIGRAMDQIIAATSRGLLPTDAADKLIKSLSHRLKAFEVGEVANELAELRELATKIAQDRGIIQKPEKRRPYQGPSGHA